MAFPLTENPFAILVEEQETADFNDDDDDYDDSDAREMVREVVKNHENYEWVSVERKRIPDDIINADHICKLIKVDACFYLFETSEVFQKYAKKVACVRSQQPHMKLQKSDVGKNFKLRLYMGDSVVRIRSIQSID